MQVSCKSKRQTDTMKMAGKCIVIQTKHCATHCKPERRCRRQIFGGKKYFCPNFPKIARKVFG